MFKIVVVFSFIYNLYALNCIKCHPKEVKNYKHNIHYTLSKAINITRITWGIKDSNTTFETLPKQKEKIQNVSDLVDDFLRRKCLKCHINNKNQTNTKYNCLACHTKHNNKGSCQNKKITISKCLTCHNKNYVGIDYIGLFPKDFDKSYRAPLDKNGYYPKVYYGIDYHHLNSDIHFQKGLSCVSCHDKGNMHENKKVTCVKCHQTISKNNHPKYHKNISCSACHSSWNNYSYELSVLRDDTSDYKKWKNLTLQEDEYLTTFLKKALKSDKKIAPKMLDWVDKKLKSGIWYSGYRYRRWEDFILANAKDGKIKIIRPLYQYRISFKDKQGKIVFDDVDTINGKKIESWIPYTPHTISKRAKSCEMCHENSLILNQYKGDLDTLKLKVPYNIIDGSPLTKKQIKKLQSIKYKKIRYELLR